MIGKAVEREGQADERKRMSRNGFKCRNKMLRGKNQEESVERRKICRNALRWKEKKVESRKEEDDKKEQKTLTILRVKCNRNTKKTQANGEKTKQNRSDLRKKYRNKKKIQKQTNRTIQARKQ